MIYVCQNCHLIMRITDEEPKNQPSHGICPWCYTIENLILHYQNEHKEASFILQSFLHDYRNYIKQKLEKSIFDKKLIAEKFQK